MCKRQWKVTCLEIFFCLSNRWLCSFVKRPGRESRTDTCKKNMKRDVQKKWKVTCQRDMKRDLQKRCKKRLVREKCTQIFKTHSTHIECVRCDMIWDRGNNGKRDLQKRYGKRPFNETYAHSLEICNTYIEYVRWICSMYIECVRFDNVCVSTWSGAGNNMAKETCERDMKRDLWKRYEKRLFNKTYTQSLEICSTYIKYVRWICSTYIECVYIGVKETCKRDMKIDLSITPTHTHSKSAAHISNMCVESAACISSVCVSTMCAFRHHLGQGTTWQKRPVKKIRKETL